MSAAVKEHEALYTEDVQALVEACDLETLDEALAATAREIGSLTIKLDDVRRRRNELLDGRKDVRRKRARNLLDAYLPPLTIYSIEKVD
jgi:hypothetical protein